MRITKELLKQIIREEIELILTDEEVEEFFGVDVKDLLEEEELEEKKQPSEKSLKKMEKSLRKTAKEKFPKDKERQNKYIYGAKRKTGWKPEREKNK